MTQGRSSAGVLVLVVALFAAVQVAMAAQYTIGGNTVGWNFAPSQNFYNDWASKIKFAVGDTLGMLSSHMSFIHVAFSHC